MLASATHDTGVHSLERILSPISVEEFRDRYWEKDFLFLERQNPSYYSDLFSFADVDRALYLAREGSTDAVTVIPPPDSGRPQERYQARKIMMGAVYNTFHRGDTLRLTGLQSYWPEVGHLVSALQEDLDARINVNFYLTGAGSQGFPLHFDTHDVLVLQVGGSKEWYIYEPVLPLPVGSLAYPHRLGSGFDTRPPEDQARLLRKIRLRAGDLLYMPRGFPHKAIASDEPSLHLTCGVHSLYWVDALKAAVDLLAVEREELRRALPRELFSGGAPPAELEARFRELFAMAGQSAAFGDTCRALKKSLDEDRFMPPDGHIQELVSLGTLTAETELERRAGLLCTVSTNNGTARIDFGANHVSGPSSLAPILEFVARERRFRIDELPGGLSANSKLVLARRLVREGLLRTVREPTSPSLA